jgi:hypothetical protein
VAPNGIASPSEVPKELGVIQCIPKHTTTSVWI